MAVWIKQGVCGCPRREIRKAIGVLATLYKENRKDFYITSLREGSHCDGSLHYDGYAVDFRKGGIDNRTVTPDTIIMRLRDEFPRFKFQLIEHQTHFHLEWDEMS